MRNLITILTLILCCICGAFVNARAREANKSAPATGENAKPALNDKAQEAAQMPTSSQLKEMKRLDYMIGQWKGTGWMEREGRRHAFAGTETVHSKLGGLALLVEGKFKDAEIVVHETLAVLSYDEKAKTYRFRTYLANGATGDHEVKLIEGGWQWGIQSPRGNIRYTIKLSDKGEWFEIGEFSQDGKSWQKFFEMTLERVK